MDLQDLLGLSSVALTATGRKAEGVCCLQRKLKVVGESAISLQIRFAVPVCGLGFGDAIA